MALLKHSTIKIHQKNLNAQQKIAKGEIRLLP